MGRLGLNQLVDQWFSESREGAEKFTEICDELNTVIEVDVPQSVYNDAFKHPNIDNAGPGFVVPEAHLTKLKVKK